MVTIMNVKEDSSKRQYAVVTFVDESDQRKETCSEVPSTWLIEDNTRCRWPKQPNLAKIYISKYQEPQDDWVIYPVRVDGFYQTWKEARLAATGLTEGTQVGRGYGITRPPSPYSPDEATVYPKKAIKQPPTIRKVIESRTQEDLPESFAESYANLVTGTDDSDKESEDNHQHVQFSDEQSSSTNLHVIGDQNLEPTETNDDTVQLLHQINEKVDGVINFLVNINMKLEEILEHKTRNPENEDAAKQEIENMLPCQNLEQLGTLKNLICSSKKHKNRLFYILRKVGGSNSKDFLKRVYTKLMTNQLQSMCSWTGQQNNFKLEGLNIINIMFCVIHESFGISEAQFKSMTMEHLRHAPARAAREK